MGLLTHQLLPCRFERARLGVAETLSLEVTLWQSYLVVKRGYHEADKSNAMGMWWGSRQSWNEFRLHLFIDPDDLDHSRTI